IVKYTPVEREAELATLLVMRDQYVVPVIVMLVEDPDFAIFDEVLQSNLKACVLCYMGLFGWVGYWANFFGCCFFCRLHLQTWGFDLDNNFFIELTTPTKWVSSMVREMFYFFK